MPTSASHTVNDIVEMKPLGEDVFQGPAVPTAFTRTFGGQVVAQALRAALLTVEGKDAHSLHCYFLEGGVAAEPIDFHVERIRDGRSLPRAASKAFKTASAWSSCP